MKPLQGFAWLLGLQLLGEALARVFRLPFPGPVIGMVLLVPALGWPAVRDQVADVARFLLGHLSLLFVPVGVGVITHLDVLGRYGLRLALVIVLSTWVGMAVTALVLRAAMRGDVGGGSAVDGGDKSDPPDLATNQANPGAHHA